MPVLDHPVHIKTRQDFEARYGCNNSPARFMATGYWHQGVEVIDGRPVPVMTRIEHRMSDLCRYDMSLADAKCAGCRERGLGEEYDQGIRSRGN